jgi:hypothetical protein
MMAVVKKCVDQPSAASDLATTNKFENATPGNFKLGAMTACHRPLGAQFPLHQGTDVSDKGGTFTIAIGALPRDLRS